MSWHFDEQGNYRRVTSDGVTTIDRNHSMGAAALTEYFTPGEGLLSTASDDEAPSDDTPDYATYRPSPDYATFLASKQPTLVQAGFHIDPMRLHPSLFPFQRDVIARCLAQGRAALFADTGLGKSRMELEWMWHISQHTGGRALLVTPLAVAGQFVRDEAPALEAPLAYCRNQAEADAVGTPLVVTNYDMVKHFDSSQFVAVALDEADILTNMNGATNKLLSQMFADTPYKLTATATPARNALLELGRYAQFLGVMSSGEMLTRYFIRDSQNAAQLRLRHWADAGPFWDWLTSWAVCIGLPSDFGDYDDSGYILPPLTIEQHTVQVSYDRALQNGQLFPEFKQSATGLWATKHETFQARCELGAERVSLRTNTPWVVWASTDEESALLATLIPDAVEVRGSHSLKAKEERLAAFSRGDYRAIVTKTKICGAGLNWQHAANMCYVSPTFSFRDFYQGLRRIYRFRQQHAVHCDVIIAETEENVVAAIQRKQQQHQQIHAKARAAMRRQREVAEDWRVVTGASQPVTVPRWMRGAA